MSNLPPGVTSAMIDRAYGFDREDILPERCPHCGGWLPWKPARGTTWAPDLIKRCSGVADEYGFTACTGTEGWTGGDHAGHDYTAEFGPLLALHSCRRCGKDSEAVR